MNKYTVLLLYPDYLASEYGHETYLAWVEADNVKKAVKMAQKEARESQCPSIANIYAIDFYPLFAAKGHISNEATSC